MNLLAIDPGPTNSAYVVWNGEKILGHATCANREMLDIVKRHALADPHARIAIEMIACYGMAVGAEVFETCVWIGRYMERWYTFASGENEPQRIVRGKVKMHLCHSMQAKDANIRQAIIDRLGAPGKKKAPGPTFGIAGDCWAALGVALTVFDQSTSGGLLRPGDPDY
jgi:hypothetical protein